MKELVECAVTNTIGMAAGLGLLYRTICREWPDLYNVTNAIVKLNLNADEMLHAADTFHAALLQWETTSAQELFTSVAIDVSLLLVSAYLMLHFHCQWARYLMALMVAKFVADVPTGLYDATFPAPEIHKVDTNVAMVEKELLVALDRKNLKHGGNIAWVAHRVCAITSNVDACGTQLVSKFEAGNVAVAVKSIDQCIPYYRDPPSPLESEEYQCFEHVRIRVKDKRSILDGLDWRLGHRLIRDQRIPCHCIVWSVRTALKVICRGVSKSHYLEQSDTMLPSQRTVSGTYDRLCRR